MASVTTGIVGSVNVELEKGYRVMLLKIANELTLDDCQQISFVAGRDLPAPTCHAEPGKPSVRLHLMSTLESLGHISPLKLDFLEEVIEAIGKKYLLEIIQGYKKNPLYKEAMRRLDEQDKKKKKGKKCGKPQTQAVEYSPEQLVALKNSTERMHRLQESYATLLTQFSQVALLMRNALESGDPAQIEQTFLSVASDGDAIARTLRRNLKTAGLKCGDEGSSGSDSQDHSPTDEEERNLEGSFSPPLPVRVESLNSEAQRHYWSTPETSPSPTQPKKPTPLPRKKCLPQQTPSLQVSSPGSSLSTQSSHSHFVFCHQETQAPSSLAAVFHIPQSASTSCLTASADYSGDYSGGTGDSGVGDIRNKYTPSQEALDQLDPKRRQQPRQDHKESSTVERSRYMKLKTKEEKCPDGYTKPLRARSLDDFLSMKDDRW